MTFVCQKLRDAAEGESCISCGSREGVVGAHYTGVRRLSYGGGFGKKVHDFMIAHLCAKCHHIMDTLSKDKDERWLNSEMFLHAIALTWERLFERGILQVRGKPALKVVSSEAPNHV